MTPSTPNDLAPSARSFVYGLADGAGHVDTEVLYATAEVIGFSSTKLRLALKRMVEAGLISSNGRGRKAEIELTASGLADRSPDLAWTAVAYRADAGLDIWDGVWHLAGFEIPESQRSARNAVRQQLVDLLGGQLSGGLYVSPLSWEPWLIAVAHQQGVSDRITLATTTDLSHAGRTAPREVAATIWPVEEMHHGYRQFMTRWEPRLGDLPDDGLQAARMAFEVATDFERTIRRDPLLPEPLVRPDFAGPTARALFIDLIAALGRRSPQPDAALFSAHIQAVDRALEQDQTDFWASVYAETSVDGPSSPRPAIERDA